jgi:hypothetical protein
MQSIEWEDLFPYQGKRGRGGYAASGTGRIEQSAFLMSQLNIWKGTSYKRDIALTLTQFHLSLNIQFKGRGITAVPTTIETLPKY